ncbi:MAG: TIGR03915 family putative DNA repair protein [Oscillibacter sp.]|jgi:probable DNA metabolism protein|nr:TIGR03915 family putative DNA repair protein [Oscillibacter sp.]
MNEMTYLYDGSFEGFLCCVFESYAKHEILTAIYSDEDFVPVLFASRTIETDFSHAGRVMRKIVKVSPYAADLLRRGFLTCLPEREMYLYRLIAKLLREGPRFLGSLSDETLYPVLKAIRNLHGEAQLLRGFVRFSELGGVLGAEIEPKNRVLPLLRGHFCSRYQNEKLFIYDRTHREILLYADHKAVIAPLEHFEMAPPDESEVGYRLLWKRFYDTIAIKERYNPKCRRTHMPMRYWNTMTEFQGTDYFKAKKSSADDPGLSAPNEKSALAIPPESEPSAPASAP